MAYFVAEPKEPHFMGRKLINRDRNLRVR